MEFDFMQSGDSEVQKSTELVPLNVIRVETGLSRYPVHRLAKQGTVSIEIREKSPNGQVLLQWEVSHNSRYGQPGPLAYKIDTLIVNRRIEEASRPIPKIIKLGSIRDICKELGLDGGKPRENVKNSLYQNAFVGIKAKFRYKLTDRSTKELEAVFTRYSVVFTGEKLPDGRKADAVYLVLNDVFMQVINGAQTRPLDYGYLKELTPASQRLYELLSFQIYATLKHGRREGKLCYSEFCTYAPLTRFLEWDQVRPQMARIHRPHLKSGYIESVDFEQTTDKEGNPDWLISYVPGSKAKAEFRAFTKKGGPRVLEIEQAVSTQMLPGQLVASPSEKELINRGVMPDFAQKLVLDFTEEQISLQLEYFDWLKEKHPKKIKENEGGFLAALFRNDFDPMTVKGFEPKAAREKRKEAEDSKKRKLAIEQRREEALQNQNKEETSKIKAYWDSLTADEQQSLEAEAGISSEPLGPRDFKLRFDRLILRETHIRKILGLSPETELKD